MLDDRAGQAGLDADVLEVVQEILGLVLEPQDRDACPDLAIREGDAVDPLADPDRVAVRAGRRVADRSADVRLKAWRHRMLQALGLLVHVVPRNADDVGQEPLDEAVAADDPLRVLAAGLGELIERSALREM